MSIVIQRRRNLSSWYQIKITLDHITITLNSQCVQASIGYIPHYGTCTTSVAPWIILILW